MKFQKNALLVAQVKESFLYGAPQAEIEYFAEFPALAQSVK